MLAPPTLAVFVGSFALARAQDVVAEGPIDRWAVLDALGVLVNKSLVAADGADPPRYRLLESTRAFALERLQEADETVAMRHRHATALRALFVDTDEARYGEDGRLGIGEFMGTLVPELDNWRAAFDWTAGQEGHDPETAIALAGAGALVLRYLSQGQEALARLMGLLPRLDERGPTPRVVWFLIRLASLGSNGRLPQAQVLDIAEKAVRLCRGVPGARRALHNALYMLAWTRNLMGETESAAALLPEVEALERSTDPCWVPALRLNVQAAIESYQGRHDASAATLAEELRVLQQGAGEDIAMVTCRCNLAIALNSAGRFEDALAMAREALRPGSAHANRGHVLLQLLHAQAELDRLDEALLTISEAMPVWLRDGLLLYGAAELSALMARCSRWQEAARLDGASERYVRDSGVRQHHLFQIARRQTLDGLASSGVEQEQLERSRREGAAMDQDQLASLCTAAARDLRQAAAAGH